MIYILKKIIFYVFQDFPKAVKKVAKFLGKTYTDEEINKVINHLNIQNFQNNPMVNYSELKACGIIKENSFIRKGKNGDWKNIFTPELETKIEKWIEENLKDTDLRFPSFNNDINNDN